MGVALLGFLTFTQPVYQDISQMRAQVASYDEALNNSKALESERDKLVKKYNSFEPQDVDRVQKLLPDHVDNIRLILEVEKIAAPYGMTLKNVKYDVKDTEALGATNPGQIQGDITLEEMSDYGTWDLEFTTAGTYENFIHFLKDLEKNLRIVDVSKIEFSSNVGAGLDGGSGSYSYTFNIKTYWLKN